MSSRTTANRIFLGWQMMNDDDPSEHPHNRDKREVDENGFNDLHQVQNCIFEPPQFVKDLEDEEFDEEESLLIN